MASSEGRPSPSSPSSLPSSSPSFSPSLSSSLFSPSFASVTSLENPPGAPSDAGAASIVALPPSSLGDILSSFTRETRDPRREQREDPRREQRGEALEQARGEAGAAREERQDSHRESRDERERRDLPTSGSLSAVSAHAPLHVVDRSFLRVPLECALRAVKANSRSLYRDVGVVLAYVLKGKMATQLAESSSVEEKINRLDLLIEKLKKIRDKAQHGNEESRNFLLRCQLRVRRLAEEPDILHVHSKLDFSFATYGDRVAWVVYEYLARSGMSLTAELLKEKLDLEPFADGEVHQEILDVLGGLLRESTEEARQWVDAHRAKLKKIGSLFESELHVQHVLELLKKKDAKTAVAYLKANVGPEDFARCVDIRKVVTLTALLEDPPPQYAALFGIERWHRISCLFLHTSAQVYGFSVKPTLVALLQAGFSALKSSVCEEQKSASCPTCLPEWAEYVRQVPTPHRVQSFLICPISGEVMDADNPPLASPDGHVYSTNAVRALAAAAPDGKTVVCPKTKQPYPLERFTRIYVT
ncbi:putative macrophage erythroblast attacher [Toxoplasma gondii TgCatPRC2]|uniref:Macrophage erythroblast attacher n=2 Tax=Toxoplasma gondii TaxID=5811 RepID=S8GGY5_TOXGM|nr:hypothetical protein TGME49_265390 [Toxoplasma gondii ME49]EPT27724.1 hypothetical protein TGME49_265390 [Toxoplasma gondii ME49]KYK64732.1 putative macrophage erythroblast attacher [Toxoplasma gondii TgCatPRC2]|eukprot:XP_002368668.2 hypothetical protein TGME49_265390 [Toxoplasma gondii ME49]